MDVEYDDITGKNCRIFRLQYPLALIGWAVYSVRRKKGGGEIVILARYYRT